MRWSSQRRDMSRSTSSKSDQLCAPDQKTLPEFDVVTRRRLPLLTNPLLWMVLVALLVRIALILYFRFYDFSAIQTAVSESVHAPDAVRHFPFAFGYETGAVAYSLATGHGF